MAKREWHVCHYNFRQYALRSKVGPRRFPLPSLPWSLKIDDPQILMINETLRQGSFLVVRNLVSINDDWLCTAILSAGIRGSESRVSLPQILATLPLCTYDHQ